MGDQAHSLILDSRELAAGGASSAREPLLNEQDKAQHRCKSGAISREKAIGAIQIRIAELATRDYLVLTKA